MELITTPTAAWLKRQAGRCEVCFEVASPFIGEALVDLARSLPTTVTKELLTRTRLLDFASGASNLCAVIAAAEGGFGVRGLDRLHAKVYVFDRRAALVTSANATYSGLNRNHECGLATEDTSTIAAILRQFQAGFGAALSPSKWTSAELASLAPAVEKLRKRVSPVAGMRLREEEGELALPREEAEALLEHGARWTHLVFRGVLRLRRDSFLIQDVVSSCRTDIAREFPRNHHPRQKIRQQLQVLRDLGLVKFISPGHYEMGVEIVE